MDYYRASVTSQSWEFLLELNRQFRIVVIGGWAVWLYTHQMKSKDIDIVVELGDLGKLKQAFDIVKNDRLKKYELRRGEVQVDVYAPFYSHLGVSAEDILHDAQRVGGILKLVAWYARRGSAKGRKDFIDMISLLQEKDVDFARICDVGTAYKLSEAKACLADELNRTTAVDELSLNVHAFARMKRTWLTSIK